MIVDFNQPVLLLTKVFFLFAFFIYIIFATVVVRQVYLMTNTLEVGFESQLRIISWLHLLLAIGVFLFALVAL
ncbi:MAG: hypothetical protein HYU80_00625 [Candidatus Blackburnbacteria bacterium]|nr:hypothetical protein [Candidatus Blackburnbacteria bacterium]